MASATYNNNECGTAKKIWIEGIPVPYQGLTIGKFKGVVVDVDTGLLTVDICQPSQIDGYRWFKGGCRPWADNKVS